MTSFAVPLKVIMVFVPLSEPLPAPVTVKPFVSGTVTVVPVVQVQAPDSLSTGADVGLVVRREAVKIRPRVPVSQGDSMQGVVEGVLYQGSELEVFVHLVNGEKIYGRMLNCDPLPLEPGQEVAVSFAVSGTWVVPKEVKAGVPASDHDTRTGVSLAGD